MDIYLHKEATGMMAAKKVFNCNLNGMICDLMSGVRTTNERKFNVYILHCETLGIRLGIEVDAGSKQFKNMSVGIGLVKKIFSSAAGVNLIIQLMNEAYENGRKSGAKNVKQQIRNILEI